MTNYTVISKPIGTSYTNINTVWGKEQYDQSDLTYDDANTFYDGTNAMQYTLVSKPVGTPYTIIAKPI